tara:strand:- start:51 stop:326 length:276 start_codon:yes stop_codon:yes gene_type:complete
MTVQLFKEALTEFLPRKIEYNLYLYEKFGNILYLKEWETFREFNTSEKIYWKDIYAILVVLERFTFKEQLNVIDFIFHFTRRNILQEKKNQ